MFTRIITSATKRRNSRNSRTNVVRSRGRALRLESLESREMFAADAFEASASQVFAEVESSDRTVLCGEGNESVVCRSVTRVVSADTPWQNPSQPLDANDDGSVSAIDALVIINDINVNGIRELPANNSQTADVQFVDVNGDGSVSPIDVLQVVNFLNNSVGMGEGARSPVRPIGPNPPNADPLPVVALSGTEVAEGSGIAHVTATLSSPSDYLVTFNYETVANSATAASDFVQTEGVIRFESGEQQQVISVPIVNDLYTESDERFFVRITEVQGASIAITPAGDRAFVTILANDPFVGPLPQSQSQSQALSVKSIDAVYSDLGQCTDLGANDLAACSVV